MANQDPKHLVTGKVRLSYVHLFTPYAKKAGDDPKFSATLLIPKSDIATKQRIDAAINAAVLEGPNTKWNGVRPPIIAFPIYDGDGVRPSDGMPFADECKGHWVVTASGKSKPEIVDLSLNPIINQSEMYSGVYARVSIRFFPYLNNGKKGIGCGLGNVQKVEDGIPLGGGRTSANSDFGDGSFGGYPAAAPAYPQQGYQQPAAPVQPNYGQPNYGQLTYAPAPPAPQPNYAQPTYAPQAYPQQPAAPTPIDPITGRPVLGNVMGL